VIAVEHDDAERDEGLVEPPVAPENAAVVAANPERRRPVVGIVLITTLLIGATVTGVVLWRRRKRAQEAGTTSGALATAMTELGPNATATELTDHAYFRLFPDCPRVLDPDDPSHETCINDWLEIFAEALELAGDPEMRPKPGDKPGKKRSKPGMAKRLKSFINDISPQQRKQVRRIIGAKHYDALEKAAMDDDDEAARKAVSRLRSDINALSKLERARKGMELYSVLKRKTDKIAWILG